MDQNFVVGLVVLILIGLALYYYFPRSGGALPGFEGFADKKEKKDKKGGIDTPGTNGFPANLSSDKSKAHPGGKHAVKGAGETVEKYADYNSFSGDAGMGPVPMAAAQKPGGCFPREQLNPSELLPLDTNSEWAQANPAGAGTIQGKNFLSAGALVGVNSIGQSMRNSNLQLRPEPPCPQVSVSPWNQSTIQPDLMRKDIFSI